MLFESKYARLDKKRFVFYIKRRTFFICNASSVQADQKNKETPDFKGFLKKKIERVMGIEPTYPAWKAGVLPLNYTRISVGVTGFEPATSWSQTRRSSQAEPHPESIVFHYTFKTSYKVQESNVFGQALDRLVTVSSMCCHTSTSALSTL